MKRDLPPAASSWATTGRRLSATTRPERLKDLVALAHALENNAPPPPMLAAWFCKAVRAFDEAFSTGARTDLQALLGIARRKRTSSSRRLAPMRAARDDALREAFRLLDGPDHARARELARLLAGELEAPPGELRSVIAFLQTAYPLPSSHRQLYRICRAR